MPVNNNDVFKDWKKSLSNLNKNKLHNLITGEETLKNKLIAKGKNEEEDLKLKLENDKLENENKKLQEEINDLKDNRMLRKFFSFSTGGFLILYTCVVFYVVLKNKDSPWLTGPLIGTIPAAMGLFGWVVKGLFPTK